MRKLNRIAVILLALILWSAAVDAKPYSYAEVLAGVGFPTEFTAVTDNRTFVNPGPVGTTIVLNSLFPLGEIFMLSPSFGFLSTNGKLPDTESRFPDDRLKATFQQSELALDMLVKLRGQQKLRIGPGVSGAWWVGAEDLDHRPTDYYYDDNRRVYRGQSFMARGVAHLMLRNPAVSGASVKLIGAIPLGQSINGNQATATGYISLQIGFSMLLN